MAPAMTFEEAWLEAQNVGTLLGAERGRVLWDALQDRGDLAGDVLELGVYKGGSALLLHRAAPTRQLHLFDTFAGHPDVDRQYDDRTAHPVGRFADTNVNLVAGLFHGAPVAIHVGVFPGTAAYWHPAPQLVVAHIDADLYESVLAACQLLFPWVVPGGVMIFDDYGFPDCPGAKRAVDDWSATTGVGIQPLPTGQCLIHKESR